MEDNKDNPCPRFYGKLDDKKKVYHALKDEIHPEVHAKWGHWNVIVTTFQRCDSVKHQEINLNKVFLTCGVPYNREVQKPRAPPCNYFQWIHTALYPLPSDTVPEWLMKFAASRQPKGYKPRPLKSVNSDQQTKWFQQAEQNVNQWNSEQVKNG